MRADVDTASGPEVGVLYAVNTFGAAAGAYLTDFSLVPAFGLRETLFVAIGLNVITGRPTAKASMQVRPPAFSTSASDALISAGISSVQPITVP